MSQPQAGQKPPLSDAEQNIGNGVLLQPQAGNVGTVLPQLEVPRLVNLSGGSARGQTVSVVFTASRVVGPQNPRPGYAGPVTGILEFGNGGRATRVEFDVPVGPYVGTFTEAGNALQPQDGGTIVTVPSSIVRALVRYDNLLLAPILNTNPAVPPASLAAIKGVPVLGPGGPRTNALGPPPTYTYPEPVQTQAMAAYFSKARFKAYKTLYLYVADNVAPVAVTVDSDGAGKEVPYCLPAFCKTVKILRMPITAALDVWVWNSVDRMDYYAVPAGTSGPEIEIRGGQNTITVRSATLNPADQVTFLALACEVGV